MNKHTSRTIKEYKLSRQKRPLKMLTCYDYQSATLLNETALDMILVGDSLGNVILGYQHTISVTLEEMIIFAKAVKRGSPDKFTVCDMPFGSYTTVSQGIQSAVRLFQETGVEALKLEGAAAHHLELIRILGDNGIPVMGHVGLTPQSVHTQGGYHTHGGNRDSAIGLERQVRKLVEAGAFAVVLECVVPRVAAAITSVTPIPTIGIGAGEETDGQVLVINDLFNLGGNKIPKFVTPVANLYRLKKDLLELWLNPRRRHDQEVENDGPPVYH